MIPKKIHYCWLSGEKMPKNIVKCMNTWAKVMPDYEVILWDKNRFDIHSVPFVEQACSVRKWAFAADYIRLYAVYTEGGIYLDSDVWVCKPFDAFLPHDFFTSTEYFPDTAFKDVLIQAAIFGGVKGHSYLKSCMDWYNEKNFILPDGSFNNKQIAPNIYADVMDKYGFQRKNEPQKLSDGIMIYPCHIFAPSQVIVNDETAAIHICNGSWRGLSSKLYSKFAANNLLRKILGKKKMIKLK